MSYHNYIQEINFARRDMDDGWYAIPDSFCNFNPETGDAQFDLDENQNEIVPDGFYYLGEEEEEAWRELALRLNLDDFDSNMVVQDKTVSVGKSMEFLVLTDCEADRAFDEYLDNYIDGCLEIPSHIRPYFDEERWKRDAERNGGRHQLASYDDNEQFESTNDGTYYIYRLN